MQPVTHLPARASSGTCTPRGFPSRLARGRPVRERGEHDGVFRGVEVPVCRMHESAYVRWGVDTEGNAALRWG
jgi:hypothetical protein